MNKYFTKQESEQIINLLCSRDNESNKLGFSLILSHPKFKNFKKLISYNESKRCSNPGYLKVGTKKNSVIEELKALNEILLDGHHFYLEEIRYLVKFIKKRTK